MKHASLIILIGIALSSLFYSCKEEVSQPNIVVFLCDDLGYGDLSSFGHPTIKTPNLDKMAASGIKLTSCYSAAPVCSPSRVGLLTGRSPNRAGVYDYIINGDPNSKDFRRHVHLQADEITIPALLKTVGYSTCTVGKWHCTSIFNSPEQPQPGHFGFDHWLATHNNAGPSHKNPKNYVRNGQKVGDVEGFSCQFAVKEAINWLGNKESDNPFYLQVWFHEPHEPIASPQELVDKYLPLCETKEQAEYFANVENMDKAVGQLMDYLEANHGENTLVLFTSDNGPETLHRYAKAKRSYGSPGDLKGMKLWTNEAGFRVPGIVSWIGKTTYTGTSDAVISSLDFLPTFCELSGAELPQKTIDGESITTLFNSGIFEREKPLLWCFYNAINQQKVAMRLGDWKMMASLKNENGYLSKVNNVSSDNEALVKGAHMADFTLYNMREDIGEEEDVADQYPEVFEKMKTLIESEYEILLEESHIWR